MVGVVELSDEHVTRVYFVSVPIEFVDVTRSPDHLIAQLGLTDSNIRL